jgi:predicted nucleotidyltransferase
VYLFGSYAKGSADEWSDIDLALVTDYFMGDSFDFRFTLTKLARSIDPDIEPHPYLTSEFNESNPIASEILKTGVRVI